MLMIFLFYSNQPIISKNPISALILVTQLYPFHFRKKKNDKMSFVDIEILRENGKFVTTVYHKSIFGGVYIYFESFLPTTPKFDMFYTLVCRCFTLCSGWIKLHGELLEFSKRNFLKKYLSNIIYR